MGELGGVFPQPSSSDCSSAPAVDFLLASVEDLAAVFFGFALAWDFFGPVDFRDFLPFGSSHSSPGSSLAPLKCDE